MVMILMNSFKEETTITTSTAFDFVTSENSAGFAAAGKIPVAFVGQLLEAGDDVEFLGEVGLFFFVNTGIGFFLAVDGDQGAAARHLDARGEQAALRVETTRVPRDGRLDQHDVAAAFRLPRAS